MNKQKIIFPVLASITAGLLIAIGVMAFTGPGSNQPPSGSPTFWQVSSSNVYFNSGNVGIGTTTPTSAKLVVNGTIAASSPVNDGDVTTKAWVTANAGGLAPHFQIFTSGTDTWTRPTSVNMVWVTICGGGGGGGSSANIGAGGGGGGGRCYLRYPVSVSGDVSVTVGTGGSGGSGGSGGNAGNNSSFGSLTAIGGGGGYGGNGNGGGSGGVGGGGAGGASGASGDIGSSSGVGTGGSGGGGWGASNYAGGGGGGGGYGGSGGSGSGPNGTGGNGSGYGTGGGGGGGNSNGGNGAGGIVIVEWWQ